MIRFFVIFLIFFSLELRSEEAPTKPEPELALGALSSFALGFGTGPIFQQRENARFLTYAVTQGVGIVLLALSLGDCAPGANYNKCDDRKNFMATSGSILFLSSRLIEIVDSTYFFILNNNKAPVVGLTHEF